MNIAKLNELNTLSKKIQALLNQKVYLEGTKAVQFLGEKNKVVSTLRKDNAEKFVEFAKNALDEEIKLAKAELEEVFGVTLDGE